MKKLFILSLITALLLCGCINTDNSQNSSELSNVSMDTSQTDYTMKNTIDTLYTGNPDRASFAKTLVTKGAPYTVSTESGQNGSWVDDGSFLTDGEYGNSNIFQEPLRWAGFVQSGGMSITIELPKLTENICDFEIQSVYIPDYAINLIRSADVFISQDGNEFVKIGTMSKLQRNTSEGYLYSLTLSLSGCVSAKAIKYVLAGTGGWSFVSEVCAYAYTEEKEPSPDYIELYGCEMPELTQENAPKSGSYNLVSGITPLIFATDPIERQYEEYNSPLSDAYMLTDGVFANQNVFTDSAYFHFTRGESRLLVFDTGCVNTVKSIEISFCNQAEAGVFLPVYKDIYISKNAKDWFILSHDGYTEIPQEQKYIYKENFEKKFNARYIALCFSTRTHCYVDEITVNGIGGKHGIDASDNLNKVPLYPNEYQKASENGLHDILLAYNCRNSESDTPEESKGLVTKDEFISYFAYRNANGEIKDYFFDSFLFLPFGAHDISKAENWNSYIDNTFAQGYNVDAINDAAAEVNNALGKSEKAKIFLSILDPFGRYTEFGDLDGDGKAEDFTNLDEAKKAIRYQVDENLRRYTERNYQNIQLSGFYWYWEDVDYNDENQPKLAQYAAEYVHSLGYKLLWIPYHRASGYSEWQAFGFDYVVMQHNYFWNPDEGRIELNSAIAKKLGMGIELEMDHEALGNDAKRRIFKQYLKGGIDYGYMTDTLRGWYISGGSGALYDAYRSTDPLDRTMYDDTYEFIKGSLNPQPPIVESQTFTKAEKKGKIVFEGKNAYVMLASSPKYGSVSVSFDGSFVYTPFADSEKDSFFVYASNDYFDTRQVEIILA